MAQGITDFRALRSAIKAAPGRLVLFVFDLQSLNGRDLRGEPLVDRRRRLQDLVGVDVATRIACSGEHVGEGPSFFKAAEQHGLEDIVSKRADSPYRSGPGDAWLKIKSFTEGDLMP